MKTRIFYRDNTKGIAILLVVLGHILPMNTDPISVWIYSFHMPVFYIITGILHSGKDYSEGKLSTYAIKKAQNTLYPYVTFSILAIVVATIIGLVSHNWNRATSVLLETVTLRGYSALWFLPSFLFSEILFFLFTQNCSRVLGIIKTVLLVCVCIVLSLFDFRDALGVMSSFYYLVGRIFVGTVFMAIGYYINVVRISHKMIGNKGLTLLVGVGCTVVNIITSQFNPETDIHFFYLGNPFVFFGNGMLGSYGIILICEAVMDQNNLLTFYGRNSMIIFATHLPLPILLGVTKVVELLNIPVDTSRYLGIFIGCMSVETVVVIMINRYFKYLTSMEELKNIKMRCKNGTNNS